MASKQILTAIAFSTMLFVGCARHCPPPQIITKVETVEIKVPIPVKVLPPEELMTAVEAPLPEFVAPTDEHATSALTPEGERMLRGLIEELLSRLKAWQDWAKAPLTPPEH